jgi:hypothetical protein
MAHTGVAVPAVSFSEVQACAQVSGSAVYVNSNITAYYDCAGEGCPATPSNIQSSVESAIAAKVLWEGLWSLCVLWILASQQAPQLWPCPV